MAPCIQKDIEMDGLGDEAEVRDVESLQPRSMSWTKSWKIRV